MMRNPILREWLNLGRTFDVKVINMHEAIEIINEQGISVVVSDEVPKMDGRYL